MCHREFDSSDSSCATTPKTTFVPVNGKCHPWKSQGSTTEIGYVKVTIFVCTKSCDVTNQKEHSLYT